jgi:hypothetical protein
METKEQIIEECSKMMVPLGTTIALSDGRLAIVKALHPASGCVDDLDFVNPIIEGKSHGGVPDLGKAMNSGEKA